MNPKPLVRGQKRTYNYEPMQLDLQEVYHHLSHSEYDGANILEIQAVEWDRGDEDAITITFKVVNGHDAYNAYCSLCLPDPLESDNDPLLLEHYICGTPVYACNIVRAHDQAEMPGDLFFDVVG